ncbi:TonB-dependent receptor [Flammeovirga sp. MY04]|uniref:TonB-dependent receptor n=1 Tax=Flammeovirga sp. MY04 TaxID=1191459 RepID=UPI0008264A24|nr:TonB-dependent receptor [Flammeovirga sp. MY04]ANQ51088.2 TonB-dependent receptor [Flammeovirga sp. MY04]
MARYVITILFLSFLGFNIHAQTTTSGMSGLITDEDGNTLIGATVFATHTPSGTKYGVTTREDGRFALPNMRVGGPYQVIVSYVGFQNVAYKDINLTLGNTYVLNVTMSSEDEMLNEIEITATQGLANSEMTGAATNVDENTLRMMPTISRSTSDFTRLTPQSDGNSFGGRNNLYNNFSLDGSIFNNSFGLDAAAPGGQTNSQPVSLDAIEQVQVSLAPYDVRQSGFTGAGVNAVTKSGTNEFKGTAYTYFRNNSMIGSTVDGADIINPDLNYNQSGFSIGGPILKNKLFFFANAEFTRRTDPATTYRAAKNEQEAQDALDGKISGVSRVLEQDLEDISSLLRNKYGYETGPYQDYNLETYNNKFLAKLDWNINKSHTFSIRYNHLTSYRDNLPHPIAIAPSSRVPSVNTMQYQNSGYRINNNFDSFMAELNSRFGNKYSNKMQIGYTAFRDTRELPNSMPFPMVDVVKGGTTYVSFGSEQFSVENKLSQNVFQFTDNFTIYKRNHTITLGTNFEYFGFENAFNLQRYGYPFFGGYEYTGAAGLETALDGYFGGFGGYEGYRSAVTGAPIKSVDVNVAQFSLYAQDEWNVNDNFVLTYGLRMDVPIYLTDIAPNEQVDNYEGWRDQNDQAARVDVTQLPKNSPMFSPRVGFNYNVNGQNTTQLRGGTGLFTGRIPFVWISNQAANSQFDDWYTFQINGTTDDFRFPQVWRSNFAIDHELPGGIIGTFEAIYTKDMHAVQHVNYNMVTNRERANGADNREIYPATGPRIKPMWQGPSDAEGQENSFLDAGMIMLDNTDKGYQYSLTGQLKKNFRSGVSLMAAYTYSEAKDVTSNPGEIAADAYQRNAVVGNPNTPGLAFSSFGLKHRLIASLSYALQYGSKKNFGTSFGMFFEAAQGNRFSYTYAGDMNRDGIVGNDLMYVPSNRDEIQLVDITDGTGNVVVSAEEQWNQLDAYISQDDYLSSRRGDYAERNGAVSPWYTQLDMKILQDFNIEVGGKKNTIQLSFDIQNLGNLLNSSWGVRQQVANDRFINFVGYSSADSNTPQYQYVGGNTTFVNNTSTDSRWRMQVGLRYIFN